MKSFLLAALTLVAAGAAQGQAVLDAAAADDSERGWSFDPFMDRTGAGRLEMVVYESPPDRGDSMLGIGCERLYVNTRHWPRSSVPVRIGESEETYPVRRPGPHILEFGARDTAAIIARMAAAARQGVGHVRFDGRRYPLRNFLAARERHGWYCARGWVFDPVMDKGIARPPLVMTVHDHESSPDGGHTNLGIDCESLGINTLHRSRRSVPVRIGESEETYPVRNPVPYRLEFGARDTAAIIARMAAAAGQGVRHVRFDGRRYPLRNFLAARERHSRACARAAEYAPLPP